LITKRLIHCFRKAVFASFLLVAIVYAAKPTMSDDFTERRITAGARIFRALLAADIDIERKTDSRGALRLCLLYLNDTGHAEKAAATLINRDDSRVRMMKVSIEILTYDQCLADRKERFAGIFVTQKLNPGQIMTLTAFANEQHMVVFSPFEGDVEKGMQSGIAVEARVRPYLNKSALQAAQVHLKPFFLKVAKVYEK